MFLDIWARLRRRRLLQREIDRLDAFASIVSPDLRTPLNGAQLRSNRLDDDCEDTHLDPRRSASGRMEEIIEDTVTLARHRQRIGEMEWVDVARQLEDCWETVASPEATAELEADVTIRADPARVRHSCENRRRTAIDHGGEDLPVRIGQADDVTIYSEDDGPGSPEAHRDSVFEPGYSTNPGGTGFGLAIVK